MYELPEIITVARQMREAILGARITGITFATKRPRFLFTNLEPARYPERLVGHRIDAVEARGKWILATLDSGSTLALGEMFGRLLYLTPRAAPPKTHHVAFSFDDGGSLFITVQAWGGVMALTPDELAAHPGLGSQGISPLDGGFTAACLDRLLDHSNDWSRKPIKAYLVHEGNVRGIGNGYLQDILFRAKLSPKRRVPTLDRTERKRLHQAIVDTLRTAIDGGGRDTEKDLHGAPGGYIPLLDRRAQGSPCPACGTTIRKITYLGGSCYLCPRCQPDP
jgi:formamidopyrimidine-DNA glycosylase